MRTADVRVWKTQVNKGDNGKTYTVRWTVGGKPKSRTFAPRALADNHRSKLVQAMNNGESFDMETFLAETKVARSAGGRRPAGPPSCIGAAKGAP